MDTVSYKLLEEVLNHPSFREWALGNRPDNDAFWQSWAGSDKQRIEVLRTAGAILLSAQGNPLHLSEEHIRNQVQKALDTSRLQESPESETPVRRRSSYRLPARYGYAAASLFILLALGWLGLRYFPYLPKNTVASAENTATITVRNDEAQPRYVQLSDGSSVVLKGESELTYPVHFHGGRRDVFLTGEAFFEVTKDAKSPFYVHTNKLITKVLGTSFRVKAYSGEPVAEVSVKTGRVAVFEKREGRSQDPEADPAEGAKVTTLHPNEKAAFGIKEKEIPESQDTKYESPAMTIETLSFEYNSTPAAQVWRDLERAYGVEIVYDADSMKHCSITAHLSDEPLLQKLRWICTILEASYTFEDNKIRIRSISCQ